MAIPGAGRAATGPPVPPLDGPALAPRGLSRTLAFALTPVEPADPTQVLAAELAIAQAAYDPPPTG